MAKAAKAKPPAKAAAPKKTIRRGDDKKPTNRRPDKRGCPKGKGTHKGGAGAQKAGPARKGRIGNPPHEPTPELRKTAETHAAVGTPHWAIAGEMGISEDTLERHYRRELDMGLIRMNARIGSSIAKKALEGDADMQKFWLARRGGPAWANKQQTELSTPPGRPIETRDMSDLTEEQLRALAALNAKPQ